MLQPSFHFHASRADGLMGAGCISARGAIILDVHKLSNGVLYDIMVTEEASLEKDATWEQVAEAPWWRVIKAPL